MAVSYAKCLMATSDTVHRVSNLLSGFDDRLNGLLNDCADAAGEDVDTYIVRAVVTRMVRDLAQTGKSHDAMALFNHLTESGILASSSMPDVSAALADPERLRAVHATGLLDSPPDEVYDRITRAAIDALDVPFATLSLIDADRQFLKSAAGLGDLNAQQRQKPLEQSICQYVVASGKPLVITDAQKDPVFKNHAAVRGGIVVAYLGIPLTDHNGYTVGALAVFDQKARMWGTGHVQVLSDLAALAAERIFGSEVDPNH